MENRKVEISRIYIQNKSKHLRRFINIIGIYKENNFFEYKITFEGFPVNKKWNFVEAGVLDAVNGLRKSKNVFQQDGDFTVGYHQDGNIMYNVGGRNFKPVLHTPISKLKSAALFLRITGFNLDDLVGVKKEKTNATTVDLKNFSNISYITCDLFISTGNTQLNFVINSKNNEVFKNSQSISIHDEDQKVSIHFHFYRSNHKGVYIVIVKKGFFARLGRAYQYFKYKILGVISVKK